MGIAPANLPRIVERFWATPPTRPICGTCLPPSCNGEDGENVKHPGRDTHSLWPLVPRSPEEQLALYARRPVELEAALAGLSSEDLDQVRVGPGTIRQIVEHLVDDDVRWTMCMQVALIMPGYT